MRGNETGKVAIAHESVEFAKRHPLGYLTSRKNPVRVQDGPRAA